MACAPDIFFYSLSVFAFWIVWRERPAFNESTKPTLVHVFERVHSGLIVVNEVREEPDSILRFGKCFQFCFKFFD